MDYKPLKPTVEEIINAIHVKEWIEEPEGVAEYPPLSMFNTSHRCPTTGRRHTIACPQMDSPSAGAGDLLSVKSPRHQRKSRNHSPRRHSEKGDGRQPSPRRRMCKDGEDEAYSAVPREYQNPKVQEADGHFFENFTALSWRQENKRLRATAEDNNEKHVFVEGQVALKPQRHKLTKREFELLYIEVLYTIKHKIGQTAGGHSPVVQDLFYYAQESFKISPEDHARLLAKATEEKPPIVILNIAVIMARDLEAKDADGFSDPYCMLGILPGRREGTEHSISTDEEESPKGKESRSKSFRMSLNKKKKDKEKDREKEKARDAIPARLIKSTGVVNNSLNPVWNERFRFDLEDVNSDKLHLDIWDHDEEFSVFDAAKTLNEVQGLRGLGRYFKQIAQSARTCKKSGNVDDFLGCVSIPLNDIPSTGIEKWFPLEGRSSRSNVQGDIKLKLYLATREDRGIDEEDNWTDVRQHEDLITIFIEHEIRKCGKKAIHWNGDLPQAARTILHQHAIQGDVTDAQQAMCMWMAFTKQHMEYLLDYGLLYNLLDNLNQLWTPDSFSREEEELLAESFRNFLRYCLSVLSKQREVFPSANKHCVKRLESMLRCASKIHEMEVFRMICPFEKSLTSEIKHAVQKSTTDFYERIYNIAKTSEESEENVPKFLINLTNNLNIDLIQATTTYNTLYERICKVHYFDIVYKYLDRKLGDEFEHRLRALRKLESRLRESEGNRSTFPLGPKIFELYFSLQEFCNFQEYYSKSDHPPAHTSSFYHWFYFVIELWLDIAKQNEERRIKTAIMLDQFAEVSKGAKYSSSAADVCCCFSQMMQFWKQLNLQNSLDIFPLTLKLTQTVCEGAILYADLVYSKIKEEGFFDEEGQFDVSEQLCASINDIEHVRRGLYQLPEALGFAEVKQALESAERSQEYSLDTMVKNADQLMLNKIQYIIDKVTDKMRPDIKKDVFHLNWAPESVPASKAIEDLLAYLDNNLVTMNKNLLKMNFDRTLVALWVETLEEFSDSLLKEEQRQPVHYQRMFDALEILVDFFHANEKGLAVKDIESRQYRDLRNLLSFYRLSTPQLIEAFYEEKLQDQVLLMNTTSKDYGVLNVRMSYRQEGHSLLIEVVNAKDIIPLDANGLSDPFVLLQLCPEHVFPNVPVQKTKVVKKTLNPVFEETFEFAVSVEQCRHPGSTLVFTVMDHDYVFQNDFAGEAFVRLSEIPGVEGESHNYEALHVVSLPLMQPRHKENGALDVLATRTGDRAAQEFVRSRSKTEELAVHKT